MNDSYSLEEIRAASRLSPSTWMELMVNEAGLPLSLESHPFLAQIYDDLSPLQVILKAPQVGATTMHVLKALWVAGFKNKQIIYTLPTQDAVYQMVNSGFNRVIAQNKELFDLVAEGDTMEHKQVGPHGIIRFRGTSKDSQAMMVPSDCNIHDEVDASDAGKITLYETRLQAKSDGWRWYFSHPSIAGYGVDIYWSQSDKKEWFITCPECNLSQYLEWPTSIDPIRGCYQCRECKAELDNQARIQGEWKPTSQGIFSGYHISQLMCPWITASKILEAFNDPQKDVKYFYNYVLGLPHADSNDAISTEQVLANVSDAFNSQEDPVIIGIDTGLPCYYTLMNKDGVFNFGHTEPASSEYDAYVFLESFLIRWQKAIMVFDAQGDLTMPRILQSKYPGRIFLCFYRKDRKTKEMVRWGEGEEWGSVIVDRNRMITLMLDQLKMGDRIRLNGTRDEWKPWSEHFANMIRMIEETPYGPEYKWEKKGGTAPDHWAHSLLYALVGYDKFAGTPAIVMGQDDIFKGMKVGRIFQS